MKGNVRISQKELFFAVTQSIIGVGILALPYHASKTAGSDGWITVFLVGIALHVMVTVIWLLNKRFPHLTLYDYSSIILGKPLGFLLNFMYIIYFLFLVAYMYVRVTDIIVRWILPETPHLVLFFMGLILFIYGCMGTLKNLISLFSFFFLFTLALCIISVFTLVDPLLDIRFLLPIGSEGIKNIVSGVKDIIPSFIGYEALLIYFGFVLHPERISSMKGAIGGIWFITLYYMSTVILSMALFSQSEMAIIPEPTLYMLRSVTVTVIERWDLIFLSIWVAIVAVAVLSFGYIASMGISKTFRIKHPTAVIVASLILTSFTLIMNYGVELELLETLIRLLHLFFGIMIPILLLGIAIIFKKKGDTSS